MIWLLCNDRIVIENRSERESQWLQFATIEIGMMKSRARIFSFDRCREIGIWVLKKYYTLCNSLNESRRGLIVSKKEPNMSREPQRKITKEILLQKQQLCNTVAASVYTERFTMFIVFDNVDVFSRVWTQNVSLCTWLVANYFQIKSNLLSNTKFSMGIINSGIFGCTLGSFLCSIVKWLMILSVTSFLAWEENPVSVCGVVIA